MSRFWGHDENLMYYVNHRYPLQREGIGATCDYILLEDGDEIDVAMFSDWNAYLYGAFAYFEDGGEVSVKEGESFTLSLLASGTQEANDGGGSEPVAMPDETLRISADGGYTWSTGDGYITDENGDVTLRFDKAGTYLVSAGPHYAYQDRKNVQSACVAPPVSVVTVTEGQTKPSEQGEQGGSRGDTPKPSNKPVNKPTVDPDAAARKVRTVTLDQAAVDPAAVAAAVKKAGGSSKYVTGFVLGSKVKKIGNGVFAAYGKATTLEVKSKKLKKKNVRGSLKGSAITSVKVNLGSRKTNKKYVKKYKKIFKTKNAGRKVRVTM